MATPPGLPQRCILAPPPGFYPHWPPFTPFPFFPLPPQDIVTFERIMVFLRSSTIGEMTKKPFTQTIYGSVAIPCNGSCEPKGFCAVFLFPPDFSPFFVHRERVSHRRRINICRRKDKCRRFCLWGGRGVEFIKFLAALVVLPRTILNNRMNCIWMI